MDKTIRIVTDFEEQQAETYRYWQSVPVGERIEAILELSETAYSFRGAGGYGQRVWRAEEGSSRSVVRVQPHKVQYRVVGGYAVGI